VVNNGKTGRLGLKPLHSGPVIAEVEGGAMGMLVYYTDTAIAFIEKATGISEDQVMRVLMARDALLEVFGLMNDPESDVDVAALRGKYRDLIPQSDIDQPFISYETEALFVQSETGLQMQVVVDALAADSEYMEKQGIVDPEATKSYREWAGEWVRRDRLQAESHGLDRPPSHDGPVAMPERFKALNNSCSAEAKSSVAPMACSHSNLEMVGTSSTHEE